MSNNLPTAPENAATEARAQAAEYGNPLAPTVLKFDDGGSIEIPPHPSIGVLDDDQLAAYEAVLFYAENCDRGPDIYLPAQKVKDADGKPMTLPAVTRPGALLQPLRKDGELLNPPQAVRIVQAALGEDEYARLRAATINGRRGSAGMVWLIWNDQLEALAKRRAVDPK